MDSKELSALRTYLRKRGIWGTTGVKAVLGRSSVKIGIIAEDDSDVEVISEITLALLKTKAVGVKTIHRRRMWESTRGSVRLGRESSYSRVAPRL